MKLLQSNQINLSHPLLIILCLLSKSLWISVPGFLCHTVVHSGRPTFQHLLEGFPEAVIQEGVEERVEAGVGVAQASYEVGDPDHKRRVHQVRRQDHDGAEMEWRPAEQAHSQDYKHHDGDFLLGLVQRLGIAVEPHVPQLVEHHGV